MTNPVTRRVNAILQRQFMEGTVYRVDLDRVDVLPRGSSGTLRSLPLSGDRDKVKPGDPVRIVTIGNERVAMAADVAMEYGDIVAEATATEELTLDIGALFTEKVLLSSAGNMEAEINAARGTAGEGWTWGWWRNDTLWAGQLHSTQAKTLLNLSQTFGIPTGVKEVAVYIAIKDSASATGESYLILSDNAISNVGAFADASGQPNNMWEREYLVTPCDVDGNIYIQHVATGTNTQAVWLVILGYKMQSAQPIGLVNSGWTYLATPLVNASWNGNAFSTVSTLTAINAFSTFGVPSNAKAVYAKIYARDSASSTSSGNCRFCLAPMAVQAAYEELIVYLDGEKNDVVKCETGIIPLDDSGNFGYKIQATGAATADCWIQIWGYLLGDDTGMASGWEFIEGTNAATWYGKVISTVGTKTAINLRSEFNLPIGATAALVRVATKDSASAGSANYSFSFWKTGSSTQTIAVSRTAGAVNTYLVEDLMVLPVDSNGDIYYTATASGTNTMTVYLICAGYLLPAPVIRTMADNLQGYEPAVSGNNGHVMITGSSGTFNAGCGTVNPAGGQNGDRYYRTDLGLEIMYWNGYWLTTQTFKEDQVWTAGFTAGGTLPSQMPMRGDYAVAVMKTMFGYRVMTTNDASNYWTLSAYTSALSGSAVLLGSWNTAAQTTNTMYTVENHWSMPGNIIALVSSAKCYWQATKTGAPGGLDVLASTHYKYIIT